MWLILCALIAEDSGIPEQLVPQLVEIYSHTGDRYVLVLEKEIGELEQAKEGPTADVGEIEKKIEKKKKEIAAWKANDVEASIPVLDRFLELGGIGKIETKLKYSKIWKSNQVLMTATVPGEKPGESKQVQVLLKGFNAFDVSLSSIKGDGFDPGERVWCVQRERIDPTLLGEAGYAMVLLPIVNPNDFLFDVEKKRSVDLLKERLRRAEEEKKEKDLDPPPTPKKTVSDEEKRMIRAKNKAAVAKKFWLDGETLKARKFAQEAIDLAEGTKIEKEINEEMKGLD